GTPGRRGQALPVLLGYPRNSRGAVMRSLVREAFFVALVVTGFGCGKSARDDGDGNGGEAGVPGQGGAGPTGGSGAFAGSGTSAGSGGATAGGGGMDPCAPDTCATIEDCTAVTPPTALIT